MLQEFSIKSRLQNQRFSLFYIIIILSVVSSVSHALALGTEEIEFTIPGTNRLVVAELYYPIEGENTKHAVDFGIWQRQTFTKNAPLASLNSLYPLVIFSHGWHGDRFGNSWIAETLVAAGYIVAMIDHQHDNSYENSDEFIYSTMWQRPLDLTALLDYLLKDPKWSQFIDKNRIAAGGFSLGGLTTLWLSGAEAEQDAFKNAMEHRLYARWNDWPKSVTKRAAAVDWSKAGKSYYDPRIKAVFAIAPDLGIGFKPLGLAQSKLPVLLIVGTKDPITPATENANYYHDHIKNSDLLTIKDAEHFTFMNNCSTLGKKITPHLCEDTALPLRTKAHQTASKKIISFLKDNC